MELRIRRKSLSLHGLPPPLGAGGGGAVNSFLRNILSEFVTTLRAKIANKERYGF